MFTGLRVSFVGFSPVFKSWRLQVCGPKFALKLCYILNPMPETLNGYGYPTKCLRALGRS